MLLGSSGVQELVPQTGAVGLAWIEDVDGAGYAGNASQPSDGGTA
ncbi:MAG TPA: hypothetical protein VFU34_03210 [Gaiellaceae bacterium]|nr:hypothetical protein [Gaiellaceae bacterium]